MFVGILPGCVLALAGGDWHFFSPAFQTPPWSVQQCMIALYEFALHHIYTLVICPDVPFARFGAGDRGLSDCAPADGRRGGEQGGGHEKGEVLEKSPRK